MGKMTVDETRQENYRYRLVAEEVDSSGFFGALSNYMRLAVGSTSILDLIAFDTVTAFFSSFPGGPGYLFRQKFYPYILGRMGRGVSIGKNVTIRGPRKIFIGNNAAIEDGCCLDARGDNARIILGDNIVLARNTMLRTRGESIVIGEGSSIGANCIFGTDSNCIIGKDVLIAAYCYLAAAGSHNYDDSEVPIIKQGVTRKGGIVIEDGAWVGARTVVLDGAKILRGAIVGANSLVNSTLPENSISFGTPAKVHRQR
jgi:acetyltransferase-like isoleucine patch superfamily enzyme